MDTNYFDFIKVLIIATLFFVLYAKKKQFKSLKLDWNFILLGLALIFLGALLDLARNFLPPFQIFIWESKPLLLFFQNIFGYSSGLVFIALGIYRWLNRVDQDNKKQTEFIIATENLEQTIKMKSIDLEITQIESDQLFSQLSSQNEALNASAIVSRVNLEGKIIYVNDLFLRITQYPLSDLIGKDHNILNSGYHPPEFWKEMWESISADKRWRSEIRNKAMDGSYFWVDTVIVPIKNDAGKTVEYLAVRFDVTERKKAIKDLAHAKNVAEDATKAKSEFLARMSHEIRTPMNAIIGLSQLALQTNLNPKQKDYVSKVNSSGKALLGIINDILDFSKIEAGKLELENVEFDLEQIFIDLENILGIKAHEKGLEFVIGIAPNVPLSLIGDPLRLGQILINLVNNAIKFTNHGEIVIRIHLEELKKDYLTLCFEISDTGIGIEEHKLDELFVSFSQADNSTTRKYGGTGLGLAISQKLAESMQGNIRVNSKIGKGSVFYFSAQFGLANNQKKDQLVLPPELQGIKTAICDKHKASCLVVEEMLKSMSLNVKSYHTGNDLLVDLENGAAYQLVLIDINRPQFEGLHTAELIRNNSKIKFPPHIIMLESLHSDSNLDIEDQFDLNSVIHKPVSYSNLFHSILKTFGLRDTLKESLLLNEQNKGPLEKNINGAKVLLVEDNEVNQQVAREIIESAGCIVKIAENGLEAVQKLNEQPSHYELIFMDIQMPIMDGYEASIQIRKNTALDLIPIVAITADAIVGIKEKCLEIGMNDFIIKPFEPSIIFDILHKYLAHRERKAVPTLSVEKAKKTANVIPHFDSINTADGIKRINNNKNLYIKLIQNFYNNNLQLVEQISQANQLKDTELVKRSIHTLKGISGNIGAIKLYQTCQITEEEYNKTSDHYNFQLQHLYHELTVVLNELKPFVQKLEAVNNSIPIDQGIAPDLPTLLTILSILIKQIAESDADAIDTHKKLTELQGINQYKEKVLKIGQELNHYNFEEAYIQTSQFIESLKS
ncbi:MAG: response regulator [Prolixibacteraceae bacterium]